MEIDPALFQENERISRSKDGRRYVDLGDFLCESGAVIPSVRIAFQTWGSLEGSGDNAILVCHALTGDSNAAAWWESIVGPGKPIDSGRYFVVCTNCLGGCQGTTGPSTLTQDGRPFGSRFPQISLADTVEAMRQALLKIGVDHLHAAAGGSMGGMQALEWSLRFPGTMKKAWLTASCAAHNAMQIGFNESQRQAVMRDPKWRGGDYPLDDPPTGGLAVSRMIAHLLFLSEAALEAKFGRRLQSEESKIVNRKSSIVNQSSRFQVESYLNYQGDKFTKRFDANSFIVLTLAMNEWERKSLKGSTTEYLFTSFKSDWLYPSSQSAELHRLAQEADCNSDWVDIDLPYGHDAFLLDEENQGAAARTFLSG